MAPGWEVVGVDLVEVAVLPTVGVEWAPVASTGPMDLGALESPVAHKTFAKEINIYVVHTKHAT